LLKNGAQVYVKTRKHRLWVIRALRKKNKMENPNRANPFDTRIAVTSPSRKIDCKPCTRLIKQQDN